MTEIKGEGAVMWFFLESVNEHPVKIDYNDPHYDIETTADIEEAARIVAKKEGLKYLGYDALEQTYRVHFQRKKSLFKKDLYIYHVLPRSHKSIK